MKTPPTCIRVAPHIRPLWEEFSQRNGQSLSNFAEQAIYEKCLREKDKETARKALEAIAFSENQRKATS